MTRFYLVLGDWSEDGHRLSDKLLMEANKGLSEMRQAYKDSCKKTGVSFNHNEDFTGKERNHKIAAQYHVCTELEEGTLTQEIRNVFEEYECPYLEEATKDEWIMEKKVFADLLMWFISLSLPGLEWKQIPIVDETPVLNGYWNEELNVQFGYGLYQM